MVKAVVLADGLVAVAGRWDSPSRTSSWAADRSLSIADWASSGSTINASHSIGFTVRHGGRDPMPLDDQFVDVGGVE